MILTKKICRKCGKERKFLQGSDRDKHSICGNCWDWKKSTEENLIMLDSLP